MVLLLVQLFQLRQFQLLMLAYPSNVIIFRAEGLPIKKIHLREYQEMLL